MVLQRVRDNWETELIWIELGSLCCYLREAKSVLRHNCCYWNQQVHVPDKYDPIFPTEQPYKLCANSIIYVSHKFMYHIFPVVMYGCESWTVKKAECQRIDAFELWCWRRLEGLLDCKEIQPVHPKGNQSWILIGRTDAEAETAIIWPPYAKTWLISKDPDAVKYWSQEEKQMTEDEMVGWHHWPNGHEFE